MASHNSSFVVGEDQQVAEPPHVVWALHSPNGRRLVCSVYRAGSAFAVRVGFHNEPPLTPPFLVATEWDGATVADTLKTIALNNGFLEVSTERHTVRDPYVTSKGGLQ